METGNESGGCFNGLETKACFWDKATIHKEKKSRRQCTMEPELHIRFEGVGGGEWGGNQM